MKTIGYSQPQALLDSHSSRVEKNKSLETQNTVLRAEYEDLKAAYNEHQKSLELYRRLYSEEVIKNDTLLKEITSIKRKKDDAKKKKLSGKKYEDTKAFNDAIYASRKPVFPENDEINKLFITLTNINNMWNKELIYDIVELC